MRLQAQLLIICCMCMPAFSPAIEFTNPSAVSWKFLGDVDNGCSARLGDELHHNIYVGLCTSEKQPAGRGILFNNRQQWLVKLSRGQIVSSEAYKNNAEVAEYAAAANYIATYHAMFLYGDNFKKNIPTPEDSERYQLATKYLKEYPNLNVEHINEANIIKKQAIDASFLSGMTYIRTKRSSREAQEFIQLWASSEQSGKLSEARQLLTQFQAEEKIEHERQERLAAERERERQLAAQRRYEERQRLIPTSCNGFYPGYVGRYRCGGWLCTADQFVVRYVNQRRFMVTIEGNSSGNSLSHGQIKEMACIDLLEGMK